MGTECEASGSSSVAIGNKNKAYGEACYAEGSENVSGITPTEEDPTPTQPECAHTEGKGNIASGSCSHAEGSGTKASSANQHVQGKYNTEDTASKYAFIIGNGTSDARSNAFAIDWNGLIYVNNASTGVNVATLASTISTMSDTITSLEARIAALEGNNAG